MNSYDATFGTTFFSSFFFENFVFDIYVGFVLCKFVSGLILWFLENLLFDDLCAE